MESREIAIRLSGVKKMYKLGQIGGGTLTADLQSWWARVRGKEDPNTKIGTDQRLVGKTFMALNGIELTVYKGEALGIIGGNGAGKSTMLKLLSRVTAPTEGEIDIYGRVASMLEVGTGFNGEMTGRENVYLNGAILGMTKAEIDAKMEDIIEFSEVREFIDTPVKRYSSGMYVKLAFSVAAHLDSEIMIMDEVLAVGDMAFQKKCLDKMRDAAKKEGRTVLYVSHNMNTIRQLCDRCVVLDKGKVVFEGDVEEAIQVYLGRDKLLSFCDIIVTDAMRNPEFSDSVVKITEIHAENKTGMLNFGDPLRFSVSIENSALICKNVSLRLVLNTSSGVGVTMAISPECYDIPANSQISKSFIWNIGNLVPGSYAIAFVVREEGGYGAENRLDVLQDVYSFSVSETPAFNRGKHWEPSWWGYFCNGDLVECQTEEV